MSGHSKWATTHRTKEAADAKRGAAFTKISNLITLAARAGGGDSESNFQLRLAMEKAREANMPKANIEKAISRGTGGGEAGSLAEVVYEIIGPAGSTFVVEAVTDNKNRTVGELKAAINKNGGQLGGPNSALWMFKRQGEIIIEAPTGEADEWELKIIDAGAEDLVIGETEWEIYSAPEALPKVAEAIKAIGLTVKESSLIYRPKEELKIDDPETREKIQKLYAVLDDLEDVNNIYTNAK